MEGERGEGNGEEGEMSASNPMEGEESWNPKPTAVVDSGTTSIAMEEGKGDDARIVIPSHLNPNPNPLVVVVVGEEGKGGGEEDSNPNPEVVVDGDDDDEDGGVRKRQGLSRSPPLPAAAASSSDTEGIRIGKLKNILRDVKRMDSMLRKESLAYPPAFELQRMYNLITCHIDSYIFLYSREEFVLSQQQQQHKESTGSAAEAKADRDLVFDKLLDATVDFEELISFLVDDLRPSIITSPEEDPLHPPQQEVRQQHGDKIPDPRKQHLPLKRILFDLEQLGCSRNYAPPNQGIEIRYYMEIREWVTYSLAHILATLELHSTFCPSDSLCRKTAKIYTSYLEDDEDIIPPGYTYSHAFQLIPLFQSIAKKCKCRLDCIFSAAITARTTQQSTPPQCGGGNDDDFGYNDDGSDDIMTSQPQRSPSPVMKSKLECLQIVISKQMRMAYVPHAPFPTDMEVRLYSQIVEHVNSSIWLYWSKTEEETIADDDCKKVNVADVVKANVKTTREQYLLEVVSYLNAIKSSCLASIPTGEELKLYNLISSGLDYSFMLAGASADYGGADKIQPNTISEGDVASLKSQLAYIYKGVVDFCDEARKEIWSIINMFRSSFMPEGEVIASEAVLDWFVEHKDRLRDTMKEFFSEKLHGRLEELDQVFVIVYEVGVLLNAVVGRIRKRTGLVNSKLHVWKMYAVAATELHTSRFALEKMKYQISRTV